MEVSSPILWIDCSATDLPPSCASCEEGWEYPYLRRFQGDHQSSYQGGLVSLTESGGSPCIVGRRQDIHKVGLSPCLPTVIVFALRVIYHVILDQYCSVLLVCVCCCCALCTHSLCSGVLLRKMEAGLVGVSHVIVDEIHTTVQCAFR